MKTALLAFLAILPALLIPAYADVVQFPTLTTDGMIDYQLDTFYPSDSTYIIQISILYEVNNPIEIPEKVTWYELDGTAHFVYLQDDFTLTYFPEEEEVNAGVSHGLTEHEIEKILEEKHQELAEESNSGFSKLRACLVEFEEQEPVRYQAWNRIANLEEFTIPDQWLNQDHYSRAELEAQKKWVICEALKKYSYIGAWEANKIIDGHELGKQQDTTDSPHTVPITEEAMIRAEHTAQLFACSLDGQRQGLCQNYMSGEKYVVPDPRIPDWYNQYREQQAAPVDAQLALDMAMLTQCENYYPLYQQRVGIELPTWLSHCEEQ